MNHKAICLLLSLCQAGSAAALGLGELNVRSSLGQPLHATIKILDASPAISADCFNVSPSVGSIAPPLRTQLSLERAGGLTLLHIRTSQMINDPIAQFVLASDCEARLQRDYTMLLDPPTPVVLPIQAEVEATPVVMDQPAPRAAAPRPIRQDVTPKPAKRSAPKAARAPTSPHTPAQRAPAASNTEPRLLLSGRRLEDKPDAPKPNLEQKPATGLSATELSDENAALSRKLAYLEAQLAALQQRNAELDAKLRTASAVPVAIPPPPPSSRPAQWPLYLLVFGLLAGAGIIVAWLRGRSRVPQTIQTLDDTWVSSHTMMPADPDLTARTASTQPQPQPPVMPPAPQRMAEIAAPVQVESTEVKDDILDQAEVYMAHGHGELAIHLLQEHLRNAPDESPVPWLLLLDLLHREGSAENYDAACIECRRHFNINLSGHPISQDTEPSQGLEAYPHLMDQLVKVWNTPDSATFFHDLIYDNRGGTRVGFEPGAYRDILMLRSIAQETLPLAA